MLPVNIDSLQQRIVRAHRASATHKIRFSPPRSLIKQSLQLGTDRHITVSSLGKQKQTPGDIVGYVFVRPLRSFLWLFLLIFPVYVQAAIVPPAVGTVPGFWCAAWGIRCTGPSGPAGAIRNMIWSIITIALSFVAIVAAGFLVYYGFLYVISRGEEDNARRAKTGIVYALLGVLIAGLAAWLVNSIINLR